MRFRYLGDKDDMTVFGYDFSGGSEPEVTDEHAIKKLSGNSHFEAVEGATKTMTEQEWSGLTEMLPKKKGGRPRKNAEQP